MNTIMMNLGLTWLARQLDGYKTYLGSAGLIVLGLTKIGIGIVGIIGEMYPDTVPPIEGDWMQEIQIGGGLIASGLAVAGIGSKIDKTDARTNTRGDPNEYNRHE